MSSIRLTAAAAALIGCTITVSAQAPYVAPYNQVIVVLDSSMSFQRPVADPGVKGRVPVVEALRVVQTLFSESSAQKRRRNTGDDRYVIVAADAASQVIWRGNRAMLASLTTDALLELLAARRQFAQCTDYEAALNAAAKALREHPDATNRYVLTFGDLVHEPATSSYRTCAAPSGEPPAGIDWDTLSAAALGFYFVSTDFQLKPNQHWLAFVEKRGLKADFKDMAQTMTQAVELPPLPPAIYRPTQAQVADAEKSWDRLKGVAWTATKVILWGAVLVVAALFGFITMARRRAAGGRGRHGVHNG
jgi:hypothetical protein